MAHANTESEGENLSRIKDILFGEDLQSIEQKLDIVKSESSSSFEKLKTELENRFKKFELLLLEKTKEVSAALENSIDNQKTVNKELKKGIDIINLEVKNEKSKIENIINENVEKVASSISTLETTINQTISKLKEEYSASVNELNKDKISKNDLADILTKLADKLKK